MTDTVVIGHVSEQKKQQGIRALQRSGLDASQAVNLMFDRLIEEGSADFLLQDGSQSAAERRRLAISFIDGLSEKRSSRFDNMTAAETSFDRLITKGLM